MANEQYPKNDQYLDTGRLNLQAAGGIAVLFDAARAHAIGHAQEHVRQRRAFNLQVAAAFEPAAAGASEQNGQISMAMPIAIRIAGAVDEHRVVEQRL